LVAQLGEDFLDERVFDMMERHARVLSFAKLLSS
jgi:hypothetical protein